MRKDGSKSRAWGGGDGRPRRGRRHAEQPRGRGPPATDLGAEGRRRTSPGVERGAARSVGKWRNVHDLNSALGGEGRSVAAPAPGGRGQEGAGCSVRLPRVGHR